MAIVAFWISFWADHSDLAPTIVDMEWSFLVPDLLWIVIALWIASRWLIAGDRRAVIATAVAGSSLAYLGLLDAASNVRHHQYTESFSRGALNAGGERGLPWIWVREYLVRAQARPGPVVALAPIVWPMDVTTCSMPEDRIS